ncbi:Transcriptional regulator MraZ [Symmachiella macrocystis]|uniref:Transcriptional regulator MraZ n=1 Tax=Symmachiella macrocystis TaxID=2527985 RepID=A0A5C6BDA5_9PLAN|nr:division/cell wall cluster transcriptional repressor MraZ [Symmachiella macrocystis]TWU09491.1 Transcriptional regulator MraZ [Symmachiella macrocystis]
MPLTGTFNRSMDDKSRFAVPKRLREQFGEEELRSIYVAPGTECSLDLYSKIAFEELADRVATMSPTRADIRNFKRLFYGRAERVDLDSQGRIRIPERLVTFAGLQKEVVLIGVHDHVEVWDAAVWQQFLENHSTDFDSMAAGVFE